MPGQSLYKICIFSVSHTTTFLHLGPFVRTLTAILGGLLNSKIIKRCTKVRKLWHGTDCEKDIHFQNENWNKKAEYFVYQATQISYSMCPKVTPKVPLVFVLGLPRGSKHFMKELNISKFEDISRKPFIRNIFIKNMGFKVPSVTFWVSISSCKYRE